MHLLEKIEKVQKLCEDIYLISIKSEKIAKIAQAGQFVNIKCSDGYDAYLRRPVSICSIDRANSIFNIAFQVRGIGTKLLSGFKPGQMVDVVGPLGKGFTTDENHENIIVVGGGIGIFPLLQLLKDHPAKNKTAILGFRCKELVVLENEFRENSNRLIIATDDGSYGEKGFVTSILEKNAAESSFDMAYLCGPNAMMKRGVEILNMMKIPCEVSMEQRMGCGIGACLVCACKTKKDHDWDYSRVCTDGPVFKGQDVIFD